LTRPLDVHAEQSPQICSMSGQPHKQPLLAPVDRATVQGALVFDERRLARALGRSRSSSSSSGPPFVIASTRRPMRCSNGKDLALDDWAALHRRVLLRPSECERASDGVANQAIVQSCWPC
jgi:hypothetical protein